MRRSATLLLALLALGQTAITQAGNDYLTTVLQRAEAAELSTSPDWLKLLHYENRRWLPGQRSTTRDPRFFLDDDGWRDPDAELRTTLKALFASADARHGDQHPQCAFIARYHWLQQQLDINSERLPEVHCSRYREWIEAINPGTVTLVFADGYMNNPASMYGHTLLRVDPPGEDNGSRLLSYVINHAADTDETSGLMFALRGLTGGYPGRFSVMPYYEKVQEYNHLESRDLWEYDLDLNQDEVDQMMRHVWELRAIGSPYYFLHHNCSYRLLKLLEVARPGIELTERFSWWATPTDTVRVALEPPEIHVNTGYRPASRTELEHRLAQLSEAEQDSVLQLTDRLSNDVLEAHPAERRPLLLESAYDLLHYRMEAGNDEQREQMRDLLVARSELGTVDAPTGPRQPETRPDQGHGTHRLGAGIGRRDNTNHLMLHWRPAYHDLLDPPAGYNDGAHITFGDTRLRYDLDRDRLELDRLRLVDVESLVPRDRFFSARSWHIGGGVVQHLRPQGGYGLQAGIDGGGGFAWRLQADSDWLFYAGLQGQVRGANHLDDTVRGGAGPRLDMLRTGSDWRMRLRAEGSALTDHQFQWRLALEQDISLSRQLGLRLGTSRESDFGRQVNRLDLTLHWYLDP